MPDILSKDEVEKVWSLIFRDCFGVPEKHFRPEYCPGDCPPSVRLKCIDTCMEVMDKREAEWRAWYDAKVVHRKQET